MAFYLQQAAIASWRAAPEKRSQSAREHCRRCKLRGLPLSRSALAPLQEFQQPATQGKKPSTGGASRISVLGLRCRLFSRRNHSTHEHADGEAAQPQSPGRPVPANLISPKSHATEPTMAFKFKG